MKTETRAQIKGAIVDVVLPLLGMSAVLTLAVIAPNALRIVDIFGREQRFTPRQLRHSLQNLKRRGFVQQVGTRTSWEYKLTPKGRVLLKKHHIEHLTIPKPDVWDGKWRIVIFDIPERLRPSRDALRQKLRSLGFAYLNLSVWVTPYECQTHINALSDYYRVGRYVRYIRADYFDGEDVIKHRFFDV